MESEKTIETMGAHKRVKEAHLWESIKIKHAQCESVSVYENPLVKSVPEVKLSQSVNVSIGYESYQKLVMFFEHFPSILVQKSDAVGEETSPERKWSTRKYKKSNRIVVTAIFKESFL